MAVYATDGRCVARGRGNRVDVRHLPAGIYVVHAANVRGTAHLKAALTR